MQRIASAFGLREAFSGEVDHLMAAVVEFGAGGAARLGFVEREVEHAPGGAEAFLFARRMPTRAEALGREDDPRAAGTGDGVSAGLFEWAHEGRDAGSARSDARGRFDEGVPFRRGAYGGRAVALEGHENGQVQERAVAVGEPAAAEKIDGRDLPQEGGVRAAQGGARRVLANVAAKGGELALFLDDPIVPVLFEDRADETARCRTLLLARRETARGPVLKSAGRRGFARRGFARADHAPVCFGKFFFKRVDESAQRDALGDIAYLDQQVKMVGHDHERRDLFAAPPFQMKAPDDRRERARDLVFDETAGDDSGKLRQPIETLQGDHVEIRRLVVKAFEPAHNLSPLT